MLLALSKGDAVNNREQCFEVLAAVKSLFFRVDNMMLFFVPAGDPVQPKWLRDCNERLGPRDKKRARGVMLFPRIPRMIAPPEENGNNNV